MTRNAIDVTLIGTQSAEDSSDVLIVECRQCIDLRVAANRPLPDADRELDRARSPRFAPVLVDEQPVGDGEDPCPEARLGPFELAEIVEHAEEHLAREVLGLALPCNRRYPATRPASDSYSHWQARGEPSCARARLTRNP